MSCDKRQTEGIPEGEMAMPNVVASTKQLTTVIL